MLILILCAERIDPHRVAPDSTPEHAHLVVPESTTGTVVIRVGSALDAVTVAELSAHGVPVPRQWPACRSCVILSEDAFDRVVEPKEDVLVCGFGAMTAEEAHEWNVATMLECFCEAHDLDYIDVRDALRDARDNPGKESLCGEAAVLVIPDVSGYVCLAAW